MPRLAEVIGQVALVTLFQRLLGARQLSHALMLEGVPGCGRRTLARSLAQAILCASPQSGDACGGCPSCLLSQAGNHPDLTEVHHDSQPGETTVEEVREQLVARAFETPLIGERRVFVLYGMERLREAAANAMLKALEEPPAGAYFILTTSQAGGVLRTIRSRVQLFRLQPLSEVDLSRILIRGGISAPEARTRAMRGAGSHRGLWEALETMPLESLKSLCLDGFSSDLVSQAMAALPSTLSEAQEAAGWTLAAEQRRAVRHWLSALAHELARQLRRQPDPVLANRIERVLGLERDLNLNLQPRLVIEALALEAERRR
jgi:DNA polymerase-3 subunit delta'